MATYMLLEGGKVSKRKSEKSQFRTEFSYMKGIVINHISLLQKFMMKTHDRVRYQYESQ